MIVKVYSGYSSRHGQIWHLEAQNGIREMIISEEWNKATVREALDVLEKVYKFNRKNIRFKVR